MGKKSAEQAAELELKRLKRQFRGRHRAGKPYCMRSWNRIIFLPAEFFMICMEITLISLHAWADGVIFAFFGALYPWMWEYFGPKIENLLSGGTESGLDS